MEFKSAILILCFLSHLFFPSFLFLVLKNRTVILFFNDSILFPLLYSQFCFFFIFVTSFTLKLKITISESTFKQYYFTLHLNLAAIYPHSSMPSLMLSIFILHLKFAYKYKKTITLFQVVLSFQMSKIRKKIKILYIYCCHFAVIKHSSLCVNLSFYLGSYFFCEEPLLTFLVVQSF